MFKLLALVAADLPVHCMRSQVLGEWTFTIGEASKDRSSCGHQRPDMEEHQPALSVTNGKDVTVTFMDRGENKVIAQHDGKDSYFSMIYDEGFEFDLDDRSFVAFSGFTGVTGSNHSECGRTQVGWYSTKDRSAYGCFYGKKKGFEPYHALDQKVVRRASADAKDNATEAANASKPVSRAEHAKKVALINERATTWRAKVYESYIEMSQQDLNRRAGHRRSKEAPPPMDFLALASHEERLALKKSADLEAALPKTFDWRNVDGEDYLEPTMDQADCGSCYAVATMRMLNARHHIKRGKEYNRTQELFSISFPLFCSEYNQGCKGGFSSLMSRWNQDVGLVPATCAPYSTSGSCEHYEKCKDAQLGQKWRADNHRYIGGYYGKANAGEMMQELMANGPVAISINVQNDFMYYMDGIYSGAHMKPIQETDGWQEMQHAVLLVAWGEENGQKYWVLQNSWGSDWGEDGGFMRIKRGENDSGVESSPEAADVVADEAHGSHIASFFAAK
jgi:cathepsin C